MMSRKENVALLTQQKIDENYEYISNTLNLNNPKFKKKNGTWNAKKIGEYLNMDPRTIRKYIKLIEEDKD